MRPAAEPAPGQLIELILSGLVVDENELLGDLAEEYVRCRTSQGAAAARRLYRRQAVRAVPRLLWHGSRTRFGWVLLGVAGAWVVNLAVLLALGPTSFYDSRYYPDAPEVLLNTAGHGVTILLGGLLAGAVAALLGRGARLVPVMIVAASCCLWAWEGPFYAVYGPGRQVADGSFMVEFSVTSPDLLVAAFWQLPTMAILMPAVTFVGGLAVVALIRPRTARTVHNQA